MVASETREERSRGGEITRAWVERLVRFAVLAPSSHNAQPWQFTIGSDHVELWADRSRQLRVCDPRGRELVLSCGAALMNFRVACHGMGRECAITLLPDHDEPDRLAWAGCGAPRLPTDEDRALFEALPRRRTCRTPFQPKEVPEGSVRRLEAAAEREGARFVLLAGAARAELAARVAESTREQFRSRAFRAELAFWLAASPHRLDGIPARSLGFGPLGARAAPWILRGIDVGGAQAARDRTLTQGAPLVAVLGTDRDAPAHWLRAGQALERVLLAATDEGLAAAYLNAPIQQGAYRSEVAALSGIRYPQIILRMGYAHAPRPTPRRPVADVTRPLL